MMQVEGTLPVVLKALDGQTEIKSKKIVMRQLTAIEYMQSQADIEAGQYIGIADLAAMTKLVDADGKEHAITYDMLGNSSRSNLDYLNEKLADLKAKEAAAE
jgi:YD repeat-containing protein